MHDSDGFDCRVYQLWKVSFVFSLSPGRVITSKLENWEIGELGNWRFGKLEIWEIGDLGNWRIGKLENWVIEDLGNWRIG